MKPLSFREVRRKLEKAGFVQVGQTGSRIKFAKVTDEGTLTATVPRHRARCKRHTSQYSSSIRISGRSL